MPFMGFLKSRLRSDGLITIATNESWYFAEALAAMPANFGFRLLHKRRVCQVSQPDYKVRTHFEKKYFEAGQSIFEATWRP